MSVTAVGPALSVDGPLPSPPEYGLLSVANVVEGEGRWEGGINVLALPDGPPALWEPCSSGTFRTKEDGDDFISARFNPVVAYLSVTCSALGFKLADFERFAHTALRSKISFAAEEMLSQGQIDSSNPFLGDTNLTQVGGGTVKPEVGLAFLENAIGATGSAGVIHATPGTAAALGFNFLKSEEDPAEGDVMETAVGTPVAIGGGYIGADPVGKTGSTEASGIEWMFATGPVEVRYRVLDIEAMTFVDMSNNDVTYRAEVELLVWWDTALQAGALVDWTP